MAPLHLFSATASIYLIAALASCHPVFQPTRATHPRRSASFDPLSEWLGATYAGLNALRVTSPTDTPLRLRSTLNALAQSHADALCAADSESSTPAVDVVRVLADRGITVDSGEMHSVQGQREAAGALGVWGSEAPGPMSAWSAIVHPGYVYVGVGMCDGSWVVVLTSEFL
ncbi:hypothetical protein LPJ73_006131 [Coemansia sp. RSA 2703]|nr:hypothetical protein LPJ73_006131 [Coemansia sp. RSA 2703]KAJ2367112.1 hypothetical protein IW150_005756 [Coemansia sp. RSA 2607]